MITLTSYVWWNDPPQIPNPNPFYSVALTIEQIRGLKRMPGSTYGTEMIRHGNSWVANDLYGKLCQQFPNLNDGLGYKLCGQGEKAGDIRGLIQQNKGLLIRLWGILLAAHQVPESSLTEEIKAEAAAQQLAVQQEAAQRAAQLAVQQAAAQLAAQQAAAAQAEALRLLGESTRLNVQVVEAECAVQAATQQVTQLETQLVKAQAATEEVKKVAQECVIARTEAEKTQ